MPETKVAVLGLGIMGAAMARQLVGAGLHVRVWNRSPGKTQPLVEAGAQPAQSAAEAVAEADLVVTMLSDGEATSAVMDGPGGALAAMRPGTLWVQMGTVGETWTPRFDASARDRGVVLVDAPVLGTREPAERGELLVLASGPEDAQDRCRPVFEAVGKKTLWVGEAGAASRLKLVVNDWLLGLIGTLAESVALAQKLELDPELFLQAIEGGPLGPLYAQLKGRMMLARTFPASFPLRLALKDARLVTEAARRRGLEPHVAAAVQRLFEKALEMGHGEQDMAAVHEAAIAS